jgi:predicted small secreted protein
MLRRSAVVLLLVLAATSTACNGGGDDAKPTSSAGTPAGTPAASPKPRTPSSEIRGLDLAATDAVQALLDATGGAYAQDSVQYADLTGDGAEDAVVPVSSGGTLGDVAFIVLMLGDDSVETLLTVEPDAGTGISVSIEGDTVVSLEPAPGPDDPECCPSQFLRKVYAWDGSALTLDSSGLIDNPDNGAKTPYAAQ